MPLLPYAPDRAIDRLILDWSTQWRSIVGFDLKERGGPGRNGIKVLRFPIWIQHFYDIGTADMRTHAMRAGWRFLVTHGSQHLAVDFRHDGKTLDRFTFHSLNTGQQIDGLRAKIDGLKVAWNYRLAHLDVPGLGESALWLLPTKLNAHPQLFFPTGTVSSSFDWDKLYTAEEYQRKLAELAAAYGNNRIVHPADLAPAINPDRKSVV